MNKPNSPQRNTNQQTRHINNARQGYSANYPQQPVRQSPRPASARNSRRLKQRNRKIILTLIVIALIVLIAVVFTVGHSINGLGKEVTTDENQSTNSSEDITTDGNVGADNEIETASTERRLTFVAAGDNIMHASILAEARANADAAVAVGQDYGNYYFDEMYAPVTDIFQNADIAFVNQESPIAGADFGISGHPNFNSPEEVGHTLQNLGFDIVNIANNHMLDMDTKYRGTGYKRTVEFWKTQPFTVIGGYENTEDYDNIRVHEIDGIKIALLSYTYGTNSNKLNHSSPDMVVPLINDDDIILQMELAKNKGDLVFVSMHWGTENTFTPTDEQKRLAKLLNTLGADVIIGHHSHTVQPVEWVEDENGNRTLVYYSLGNLISTMQKSYNMVGIVAQFDIVRDASGNVYIDAASASAEPIVCHYLANPDILDEQELPTRTDIVVYPLDKYTEGLASAHGAQLYGAFTLDTLWRYVTDTIDAEFLD